MQSEVIVTPEQVKLIEKEKRELKLTLNTEEIEFLWCLLAYRPLMLDPMRYQDMTYKMFGVMDGYFGNRVRNKDMHPDMLTLLKVEAAKNNTTVHSVLD